MSKLKDQAINSVMWTTIRTILTSLCGPLLLLVKARYLTPAEFGVMAILNVVVGILNVLENFGFSQAVIQRDVVSKDERSSLFFFEIFFCLIVGGLLILLAPVAADFFDMPPLTRLFSLLSLVVFMNGPVLLFTAFLEKEFHFKELSIIQIIREVTVLIATFLFLVFGFGLTGVVLGQIVAVGVMTVLILTVAFRYDLLHLKVHFRFREVKGFLKFGVFVSGKQMMTHLTHHIDEMIIGYFLSAEVLGLYHFAKNMLGRLRTLITTSFAKVLFPILSKVKNDPKRLTTAYNDISRYIGVFAFPVFIGIAITAHLFIPVFFGEQWVDSIPFFQILSITFIPYILTANLSTSLLYSVGKPNLVFYTDVIVNSGYVLLLVIISWLGWGIYPVVILYTVYIFVKTLTLQYLTSTHLHTTFRSYLALFKYIVVVSLLMIGAVLGIQYMLHWFTHDLIELIISIVSGVCVYFAGSYWLDKQTLLDIKQLVIRR